MTGNAIPYCGDVVGGLWFAVWGFVLGGVCIVKVLATGCPDLWHCQSL